MCNFINPAKSFAIRHQYSLGIRLGDPTFSEIDFTEADDDKRSPFLAIPGQDTIIKLYSSEYPHPLNKGLIFKIVSKRTEYWMEPTMYYMRKSDGQLLAEGPVYELKKRTELNAELKKMYDFLARKFPHSYVLLDDLSYRVDYTFRHTDFGDYIALIRGLI